ncbi:MAG TPA: VOC family protein [Thermoanaerobaculia bacterium]|nr:VOC family protein [Thermoanaerobaculia bacterium]
MKLHDLTPMLRTKDLQGSVDFYVQVLGFTCEALDQDWGWASLQRDEVAIMLALPNAHQPFDKPAFTGSLYIKTDDVDALWQQVKDKAEVCYPVEDFDYGMREFAIFDNNGYLLQFGQAIG